MPRAIVTYQKELPEIPDRCPWQEPSSFLEKDETRPTGWRVNDSGRRPSNILLVPKLRAAVDDWRHQGYPNASAVTQRLFEYWFEEDHEVTGFPVPFRYYFCQREAIETLAYLVEIAEIRDARELIDAFATVFQATLLEKNIVHETTTDGTRRIRRYFPEEAREGVQELPPQNLSRYAFKMATGSGKTWVIAMVAVWSHFHKRRVTGSPLSTNFLILAPNIIVYQRLERDFASNRIFNHLPLIPPEWRGTWSQKVILRGESTVPDPSGNLFLTNIQQIHLSREAEWTPANAVDAMLGRVPNKDLASYQRSMLERIESLKDLVVMNDEAHHVHDEDLAWHQSLIAIHEALPKGLSVWLDFSATPKFSKGEATGTYYPWTICDYPLAQAVEDRIVKAPIVVTREDDPKYPTKDPDRVTKDNAVDKYGFWIHAAVDRWKTHYKLYKQLGPKPVLFIMAEKNNIADAIGEYLKAEKSFGFRPSEVLIIHTDSEGEITKASLEEARLAAAAIDEPDNKIKVIVSVMMLREGWDVKNVTVALGLRPFTAGAEILPEQVVGRGLRLIPGISPDHTQTLEVLGTKNLLDVLRERLEVEGVSVITEKKGPPPPVVIEPVAERMAYDIAIPLTKPVLHREFKNLSALNPTALDALYDSTDVSHEVRVRFKAEFATIQAEVGEIDLGDAFLPMAQDLIASITNKVMQRASLSNVFAQLYPLIQAYVANRCFGKVVNLDSKSVRSHLREGLLQDGIAKYFARKIGELTIEKHALEFQSKDFKLSQTNKFTWRRNLPPLEAEHTVFSYVATYNNFERRFAEFLEHASDVLRFASLGTTEQGESGTQFHIDYLKPSGAIGFYYPDWVVVQKTPHGEVNWIIETKGRLWEGTAEKDAAIKDWCERITKQMKQTWRYARVNQSEFDKDEPKTLAEAVGGGTLKLLD